MVWDKVTIEPAMFLQMAGDTLTYVIYQNLFIQKICQTELKFNDTICSAYASASSSLESIPNLAEVTNQIQEASSNFVLYNAVVENFFPVILVLLLGVWSDAKRRRKPPLLSSLVGKLLRSTGLLLNAWFMNLPTTVLLFTAALPHGLGGANAVFHMASFSYIADSSAPRSRTWRLGIAEACWHLGSPVGLALGAYLFEVGGYICVFSTSVLFHLIAVLYTAFLLPEVPQPKPPQFTVGRHGWYGTWTNTLVPGPNFKRKRYQSEREDLYQSGTTTTPKPSSDDDENHENGNNNMTSERNSLLPPMKNYNEQYKIYANEAREDQINEEDEEEITVKNFVIGSMKSIIKERPKHGRKCLISIGLIILFYAVTYNGEVNMKYLFTRNKFGFREQEFSNWAIFEGLMVVSGLVIVMPIFSKLFKFSDPFAGILAALGRLTSRAFIAFAPSSTFLYIASIIDIVGVMGPLSARSLASKVVLRDERGRVFAFLGCIEALVPLFAVPLYSVIYSNTLSKDPSTIYYVSCGLYILNFMIFGILLVALKMKVVQFTGTDTSSLTDPIESVKTIPGTNIPLCYRRTSLA